MSREGQRGLRRSNQRAALNRRAPWSQDTLTRDWAVPTGLIPAETPGIALQNTFEGGTAGTGVTNGNSGGASGDILTSVFNPSGCTQNYESDGAGGLLLRMTNTASSGGSHGWDVAYKSRFAARWRYTPSSGTFTDQVYLADIRNSTGIGGSNAGLSLRMNASQQIRILNRNGFSYPLVLTTALSVGTAYQIEFVADLVAGTAGIKLWSGDGSTLLDSGTVSGQDFRAGTFNQFRLMTTASTTHTNVSEFDDIALSFDSSTYIGPIVAAGTNAPAGSAAATGTAYDTGNAIVAPATEATATGAAPDPAEVVTPVANEGAATGTAYDATVSTVGSTTALPNEGAATGTAYDATIKVTSNADVAPATGSAPDGDVASSSIIPGGNAGNSTSPSVTLSSSIQPGQVIALLLTQNNTDAITTAPSALTPQDASTPTGGGQGAANLYLMTADSSTAGSTLTWTLSAVRNWVIGYIALSDIEQDLFGAVSVLEPASDTVASTTTFTAPSADAPARGYLVEFFAPKADGTALTGITPPSGFTEKFEQLSVSGTFGMNVSIAVKNGNPVSPGTYGGDTWTTSAALVTSFRYTLVLRQAEGVTAGTGDALAFDATIDVKANATEAVASGDPQWTTGDVVDLLLIGDNPIYVTGTAYDATVSTAVTTTATPTSADATGAAYDAGNAVAVNATEATATGTAYDTGDAVAVNPAEGAATATAYDTGNAIVAPATEATATGVANQPVASASQTALPTEGAATGTAYDAVTTSSGTALPAEGAATGAASDAAARVTPNATEAVATGTGQDASTTSTGTALPTEGAATGVAYDATVSTSGNTVAPAAEAVATSTAYDAAVAVVFPATEATAAGAAVDAAATLAAAPGSSDATGAAGDATGSVAPTTGATATGAAQDGAASIAVNATEATATGTAPDPTATGSGAALPTEAPATGAAYDAVTTSSGTAAATEAVATGTGLDATTTASGTAFPTEAPATGTASDAGVAASGTTNAAEAVTTGAAYDATTTSSGTAATTDGAATGAAYDATISIAANATPATTTGTSGGDVPGVAPTTTADAVASAYDATIRIVVGVTEATAAGGADNGTITSESQAVGSPTVATLTSTAYDATVRLTTYPGAALSGVTAGGGYLNLQVLVGRSHAKGGRGHSKAGGNHGRSRARGGYGQSGASGGRGVSRADGGDTRT